MIVILPLLIGWVLDLLIGDPTWLPHPVVGFGKMISWGEHRLNQGLHRMLKGALLAIGLILLIFFVAWCLRYLLLSLHDAAVIIFDAVIIFYCLAGTTLIREVRAVFHALDRSLEEGRQQVARIVGRDTSELSAQEVRTAALETLAEANYIPARLTALLMILASWKLRLLKFVWKNGRRHASPNSGYPEAALAGILDCRFGGPHYYFGQLFDKPYIGENERLLTTDDMTKAVRVNRVAEILMILIVSVYEKILLGFCCCSPVLCLLW